MVGSSAMSPKHTAALVGCSRKRRRRHGVPEAAAAAADTDAALSWASLPEDLVRLIGWRVVAAGEFLDYVRFRAACRQWRSGTECPRGRGIADPRFHPRRWMMLPEGHGLYPGHGKLRGFVRFVNLSSGAFVRSRLPLFRDHCVLDSIDGILVLQRDHDTAIRLLHPFTGDIADLPPLSTLLPSVPRSLPCSYQETGKWEYLRNDLVTSISVSADGVITVMMWLRVAFAASGHQQWSVSPWVFKSCYNPLSFRGRIYLMHPASFQGEVNVFQLEPPHHQQMDSLSLSPPKLIATFRPDAFCYLVECDSEILVAVTSRIQRSKFSVFKLADLMMERIVPLTSIGGNALFLHDRRTLSVNSKALHTIVEDTIVFFGDKPYLMQYHLNTATCSQADVSPANYRVPGPSTIIYHILTCCYRDQWNKGSLVRVRGSLAGGSKESIDSVGEQLLNHSGPSDISLYIGGESLGIYCQWECQSVV